MKYIRKTRDYYKIEQYTGPEYGWEEVCGSNSWKEARANLKEYRENQPEYPARMRKTREVIEPRIVFNEICSRCGESVRVIAYEGNYTILYGTSDGAKLSQGNQIVTCKCSPHAQFYLSAYGVKLTPVKTKES